MATAAPAAPLERGPASAPRLPSPTLIFLGVLGVVLVCITIAKGLYDPDYFWHLTTGRLIATTGHIPSTDPFSFTWAGKPWTLHEWLGELILYWLVTAIGSTGAMVVFGGLAMATFGALAVPLRRAGLRTVSIMVAMVLGAWVLVGFLTVRPQVISFLMLAGLLAILMSLDARRPVLSLVLIPYFVLWANLHGLWVVGLGTVGMYLLFTLAGRTPMSPAWRWMLAATVGTALAVMATPAGPAGILYPLRYVQPGNWGLANIQEWQSNNFHDAANWGFLALVLALVFNGGRGTPGWLVALTLVGVLMGLFSVRNDPLAAVFAVPSLALGIEARVDAWRPRRAPISARMQRGRRMLELTVGVVLVIAAPLIILPESPLHIVPEQADPYPAAAVSELLKIEPNARVLAEYGWGGYVISRMYDAGGRVFVDGRNDMYSEQILNDYSTIRSASGNWVQLLDQYGVQAILFPPGVELVKGAAVDHGWCTAYSDSKSVLLVRDCSLVGTG